MENEFLQMLLKNYMFAKTNIHIFAADHWHSNQNLVQLVHLDPAMTLLLTVVVVLTLRFTWLLLPGHVFHQVNDPFTRAGHEYVLRVNYKHLMLVCLLNGMNRMNTEIHWYHCSLTVRRHVFLCFVSAWNSQQPQFLSYSHIRWLT